MAIPGQTLTINENGLGIVEPATNIPLYMGFSSLGTANVLKTYNSVNALVLGEGQGAAVDAAAFDLQNAGGPIRFMKLATSVAASNTALANTGGGPVVTILGDANDDYDGKLLIVGGGALGVGTFQYYLDGRTPSEVLPIPAGGTFAIPNTNLVLTFPAGTYIAGATYVWTSTAPMWNSTNLSAAFTALLADSTDWDFVVAVGRHATAAAAATLLAALQAQLVAMANVARYKAGMLDAGDEATAAILTAYASVTGNRVLPAYRDIILNSAKPFPGWATPKYRAVNAFGMRAHQSLISTDLGRVKSGPIPTPSLGGGTPLISHDEYKTEVLDAAKIATLRTHPQYGSQVFITNGRLKSAAGSDFQFWQHRRIMDVACATVSEVQALFINSGVRAKADGSINDADAAAIETEVQKALDARLLNVINAEGKRGHVSAVIYSIDKITPMPGGNTVIADLAVQPLNYAKFFRTTLGFVAQIAQAA